MSDQYGFFAMLDRMQYINRWGLMRNSRTENIKVLLVVLFPITITVSGLIGLVTFIPYTLHCLYRAYF